MYVVVMDGGEKEGGVRWGEWVGECANPFGFIPIACLFPLASCAAVRYVHPKEVFRKLRKECHFSS